MKVLTLGYHDILEGEESDASGFPGPTSARYKIGVEEFGAHLDAIASVCGAPHADVRTLEEGARKGGMPLLLTFDDGGVGALATAGRLEERGWRGHFFITAGMIGTGGFLDGGGVRELRRRGHVVGTHSWSHPSRMSSLDLRLQEEEWTRSIALLSDLIGERVDVGSVPGGYYDAGVARAAAAAGVTVLFTSEPTARTTRVAGCFVLGRYSIWRGMTPALAASLASGAPGPRARQALFWSVKKAAKSIGGEQYLKLRRLILARGEGR